MATQSDDNPLSGSMSAIERFLQNLIAERPERRRSPGVAGYLCKKGVGEPDARDPRWVVYRPEHFARAEALLSDAELPTEPPPKAPPEPAPRARSRPKAPHEERVAVFASSQNWPKEMLYAAMRVSDAARVPHDVILLCQDIAALHAASEHHWVQRTIGNRRALMLYRGGVPNTGFAVRASAAVIAESQAPVLALVNLDATGLLVAARASRLEAICVPSWEALEGFVRHPSARRPARVNRVLDEATHADVRRAWALVRNLPADFRISPELLTTTNAGETA